MSIPSYEQLGLCQSKFYFEWYLGVTWDFLRMCVVSVYFMCVPLELLDLFQPITIICPSMFLVNCNYLDKYVYP